MDQSLLFFRSRTEPTRLLSLIRYCPGQRELSSRTSFTASSSSSRDATCRDSPCSSFLNTRYTAPAPHFLFVDAYPCSPHLAVTEITDLCDSEHVENPCQLLINRKGPSGAVGELGWWPASFPCRA